ncbi:MAG TPA: TetR/AcrR family transcriptional regulator [Solirubrobacterales bacterium]
MDQRRRLLEALPRAVAENGFEGTTVEHIVKLAQVRRNAFYEQFGDKGECFAAAYEIAQERLLGVLTFQCYTRTALTDRIGSALRAGLDLLGADPVLANLIVIEAPAAGAAIAARHHDWLDRYGRMLRFAAIGDADVATPRPALEPAIVGGIVSRAKQLVLAGESRRLPGIHAELVEFALSFYGSPEPPREPLPVSPQPDGEESAQPQSPERPVLETV